ncbi:MAG: NrpR regulatory domain-containing protein, partial [Nitrososphaerota archaeon]|nr:NrpR regulatory domain-containing protein [Nitrososphaerota archaeon]
MVRNSLQEQIKIGILKVLSENNGPVGSTTITRELIKRGIFINERTVRNYLKSYEKEGLVSSHGKNGRSITEAGLRELSSLLTYQRLDFVLTRYLSLAYSVTFTPKSKKGKVVANVTLLEKKNLDKALDILKSLNQAGLLLAPYLKIIDEEESYEKISVNKGRIAILTVCNLTIDGILIRSGIPLILKYGGLVQLVNRNPIRFIELMSYEGTTVPPLEVFTYRNTTSIISYLNTGTGTIPVNYREIPGEAVDKVKSIISELSSIGWKVFSVIGHPDESVLGIPVSSGRCGIS